MNITRRALKSNKNAFKLTSMRYLSKHLPSNVSIIRADDILVDEQQRSRNNKSTEKNTSITMDVEWKDGEMSSFHIPWLLANCPCRLCKHQSSGQRLLHDNTDHLVSKPNDKEYPKAKLIDNENIQIMFNANHVGVFPTEYLRNYCYSKPTLDLETKHLSALSKEFQMPIIDFNTIKAAVKSQPHEHHTHHSKEILSFLSLINENHVCLIKDTPTDKGTVEKIANLIGPVTHTIYGNTFDVVSVPNPINVAYSSEALAPHMDLAYYESPPGLQLLHCIRFDDSVKGGESTFVDGHAAAELLRKHHPEAFDVLTKVPATFQKYHFERAHPLRMYYQRPHINVNYKGDVTAVFWAPPFEGPLHVSSESVEPYYEAREKFEKVLKSTELWENHGTVFKLIPGDLVIFNNRRMLHGRTAFTMPHVDETKGIKKDEYLRHLEGAYVDIDTFLNKFRVYYTKYGPQSSSSSSLSSKGWGIGVPTETRNGTTSHR